MDWSSKPAYKSIRCYAPWVSSLECNHTSFREFFHFLYNPQDRKNTIYPFTHANFRSSWLFEDLYDHNPSPEVVSAWESVLIARDLPFRLDLDPRNNKCCVEISGNENLASLP